MTSTKSLIYNSEMPNLKTKNLFNRWSGTKIPQACCVPWLENIFLLAKSNLSQCEGIYRDTLSLPRMKIIYSHSINIYSLWVNNNICVAAYVLMCLVIGTISDFSGYILKYRVYIPYFLNLKKIWIFKHIWPHEFLKRKLLERYFFFGYRILGWIHFF